MHTMHRGTIFLPQKLHGITSLWTIKAPCEGKFVAVMHTNQQIQLAKENLLLFLSCYF